MANATTAATIRPPEPEGQGLLIPSRPGKVDDDDLQHQRSSADDPDEGLDRGAQRLAAAHGAKRHHKAQRQREQQRQGKQLTVEQECAG
mgnify:CR=1 FL=1